MIANERGEGTLGSLGVCLTFGLIVAALVYVLFPGSGGHLKPAVSLGLALIGRLRPRDAVACAAAQCLERSPLASRCGGCGPRFPADLGTTAPTVAHAPALIRSG
jgi:hypothetical protein